MRLFVVPLAAALLSLLPGLTAPATAAETTSQRIEIRHADKVEYNADARLLVLTGSVHIVRGTMSIKGDRVEVRLSEDEKKVEAATATGRVEVQDGPRRARAERAVFVEQTTEITLTGDPRLWNGDNELEADRIVYNINTRAMNAEGRVRGQFLPGQQF